MDRMADLEKGTDLSSFAMLLLETSGHGELSRNTAVDSDITADDVPDIADYRLPGGVTTGSRSIKNFFRKRHKSTSSGGGSPSATSDGVSFSHFRVDDTCLSAPGPKVRSMFPSSLHSRFQPDPPAVQKCNTPNGVSKASAPQQCTYTLQSETNDLVFTAAIECESSSSEGYRSRGSSGDSAVTSSSGSTSVLSRSLNVYNTPVAGSVPPVCSPLYSSSMSRCQRSYSVREESQPIGPNEFVEMFRSRAYSDPRMVDRSRLLAKRNQLLSKSPPSSATGSWTSTGAFEPRQMIIWKDPVKGMSIFRLPSTDEEDISVGPCDEIDELIFLRFLKAHSCYDVMPTSNKMIVLDSEMNVKKAFYALVNNGIRAAPLWDSDKQTFTGIFSITDFIKILLKYHSSPTFDMEDLEDQTIASWNELLSEYTNLPLVSIEPDATMLDAIRTLCLHHVHRVPVIDQDSGNILYLLTHRRLLQYLFYFFQQYNLSQPAFMEKSIGEMSIGTYSRISTVKWDTPLVVALELFISQHVSALPVVDTDGRLIDVYAKSDVMSLAAEKSYTNLNSTLKQVLSSRKQTMPSCECMTCMKTESLGAVVSRIVKNKLHRVYVVDSDGRVEGVVSLSDILRQLVLTPSDDVKEPMDIGVSAFSENLIDISY